MIIKRLTRTRTTAIALILALLTAPVYSGVYSAEKPVMYKGNYAQIENLPELTGDAVIIKSESGDLVLDIKQKIKKKKVKKKKKKTKTYTAQLYSSNNTANQRFSVVRNGDGTYRIKVLRYNKALTVKGSVATGTKLGADKYKGKRNQKWIIQPDQRSGSFTISPAGNRGLCIGVNRAARSAKLQLVRKGRNTGFSFFSPMPSIPDGTYMFMNKANKEYRLNIKRSSRKKGAKLELKKGGGTRSQMFVITWNKRTGYYTIRNVRSGRYVDVKKGKTKSGATIQQWKRKGKFSQYWMIDHVRDGHGYDIRWSINGMQLSVKKGKLKKRAAIVTARPSNSAKRAWLIRKIQPGNNRHNARTKLSIPTNWYGAEKDDFQAYHPKVVGFDESWNGYRYWMAYTPYPNSDASYEDPCIVASNDLVNWEVPEGLTNPIDDTHTDGVGSWHNSDTHLLYNPDTGKTELFWRYVYGNEVQIYRSTSDDGITWSEKELLLGGLSTSISEVISPAIIYEDGTYRMWYVKSKNGQVCYRESQDAKNWTPERELYIPYGYTAMKTWHLDVEKTDRGYEALLSAYDEWDNRNRMDLWHSVSLNGIDGWSRPKQVIKPSTGSQHWDNMGIYRSCLLKSDGKYYIFYGATSTKYTHGIGMMYGENLNYLIGN